MLTEDTGLIKTNSGQAADQAFETCISDLDRVYGSSAYEIIYANLSEIVHQF